MRKRQHPVDKLIEAFLSHKVARPVSVEHVRALEPGFEGRRIIEQLRALDCVFHPGRKWEEVIADKRLGCRAEYWVHLRERTPEREAAIRRFLGFNPRFFTARPGDFEEIGPVCVDVFNSQIDCRRVFTGRIPDIDTLSRDAFRALAEHDFNRADRLAERLLRFAADLPRYRWTQRRGNPQNPTLFDMALKREENASKRYRERASEFFWQGLPGWAEAFRPERCKRISRERADKLKGKRRDARQSPCYSPDGGRPPETFWLVYLLAEWLMKVMEEKGVGFGEDGVAGTIEKIAAGVVRSTKSPGLIRRDFDEWRYVGLKTCHALPGWRWLERTSLELSQRLECKRPDLRPTE